MPCKEKNAQLARRIVAAPFWRREFFPCHFAEGFGMDYPFAPPGMPQHFDVWESERCFEWLNRSVKRFSSDVEEFYSTPDPNRFWAVGRCRAKVLWGDEEGEYASKYFLQINMTDGKVGHIVAWLDPLGLLRAAGLRVPVFHMDLRDAAVDEYLAAHPRSARAAAPEEPLDMSLPAIVRRRDDNLEANFCGVRREEYRALETVSPDFSGGVWFVPHEMDTLFPCRTEQRLEKGDFPPELSERCFAWTKASSPWMYRDTRGELYPTDDESVYFATLYGHGPGRWRGNGCDNGHYHQSYLMVLKFDEAGRMLVRDEVLNPVNKYNCVGLSLPSFPYYH